MGRLVIILALAGVLALLAGRAGAQCDASCGQEPEPIIGMACTDLYPWSCDAHQLYLPEVAK